MEKSAQGRERIAGAKEKGEERRKHGESKAETAGDASFRAAFLQVPHPSLSFTTRLRSECYLIHAPCLGVYAMRFLYKKQAVNACCDLLHYELVFTALSC